MPSCVVRCCKNSSIAQNKTLGITFHKFPRDFVWKQKWIDVIRVCRSEETWIPSKFSVVCSSHFADEDLYQTKFGLRRVRKNAIPKQNLSKSKIDSGVLLDESVPSTSNTTSQTQIIEIKLEPCNPETYYSDVQQPIREIKMEPRSSETFNKNAANEVQIEPPISTQQIIIEIIEPISTYTHNTDASLNEIKIEPTSMSLGNITVTTFDRYMNIETIDVTKEEENQNCAIDSVYDSPLESKLKTLLRKEMKLGVVRQKKIKILNQRLRRMENTNIKLRDAANNLKEQVQTLQSPSNNFRGSLKIWVTPTEGDDS